MKKNKAEEGGRRKGRPPKEVTFEEIPKKEGGASPEDIWGREHCKVEALRLPDGPGRTAEWPGSTSALLPKFLYYLIKFLSAFY